MALTVAAAQLGAPWLELLPDLEDRVLAHFPSLAAANARDVCAAACVCRAWARAAAQPAVWRHIRVAVPTAKRPTPLTDRRLGNLVARAQGDLRSLDVTGCVELTDGGIAGALSYLTSLRRVLLRRTPPPAYIYEEPPKFEDSLEWPYEVDAYQEEYEKMLAIDASMVTGQCPKPFRKRRTTGGPPMQLTAVGIANALHASAPLEELHVDGMRAYDAAAWDANAYLATLLPLVGGHAERLDVVLCGSVGPYWAVETSADDELGWMRVTTYHVDVDVPQDARCKTLQTRKEAARAKCCQSCGVTCCAHVSWSDAISKCSGCWQQMCGRCQENCEGMYNGA